MCATREGGGSMTVQAISMAQGDSTALQEAANVGAFHLQKNLQRASCEKYVREQGKKKKAEKSASPAAIREEDIFVSMSDIVLG